MTVTEACMQAMVELGVLMNGEVPAGMDLLQQETITVGFIGASSQTAYPMEELANSIIDGYDPSDLIEYLSNMGRSSLLSDYNYIIPDYLENAVTNAIGHWYEGNVEFVPLSENPDIQIMSYFGDPFDPLGFASFPPNDWVGQEIEGTSEGELNPIEISTSNTSIIGLNIGYYENPSMFDDMLRNPSNLTGQTPEQIAEQILIHEFGHTFGVLHPDTVAEINNLGECAVAVEAASRDTMASVQNNHAEDTWYTDGVRNIFNQHGGMTNISPEAIHGHTHGHGHAHGAHNHGSPPLEAPTGANNVQTGPMMQP